MVCWQVSYFLQSRCVLSELLRPTRCVRYGLVLGPNPWRGNRGGDGENGVLASSRSYFYECGVLRFVLQQDSQHSKSPFKKTTKPRYRYRKSETHTQPTPRSNRSTVRYSQHKTSPWHPHHVSLPPSILPWLSGTLPWLQPAPPHLLMPSPRPVLIGLLLQISVWSVAMRHMTQKPAISTCSTTLSLTHSP